jgi:hypothetical protein
MPYAYLLLGAVVCLFAPVFHPEAESDLAPPPLREIQPQFTGGRQQGCGAIVSACL